MGKRVVKGMEERRRLNEEPEISRQEISRIISKLRNNKAMGWDKIPNKA